MTPEEFTKGVEMLKSRESECLRLAKEARTERENLAKAYAATAFAESPYNVGDPYRDKDDSLFYVAGAYTSLIYPDGHVYLIFNFAKKDGSMSKVSAFGRGGPRVRIK